MLGLRIELERALDRFEYKGAKVGIRRALRAVAVAPVVLLGELRVLLFSCLAMLFNQLTDCAKPPGREEGSENDQARRPCEARDRHTNSTAGMGIRHRVPHRPLCGPYRVFVQSSPWSVNLSVVPKVAVMRFPFEWLLP